MRHTKQTSLIRKLFKSSVVSLIVAVIATMVGVVIDGVVISRALGPDAMAAYGLITPVVNMASVFSGVLSTGIQVVCAQHLGAGDAKSARRAFSMAMVVTLIVSALMLAGVLIFRTEIAVFLGARDASAHLLPYAKDYLLGVSFSLPLVIFLFEFNALMRLDGDANRVIIAVGTMTIADIAGDIINVTLIKGGMLGMGLATSISYLLAGIIMALHFAKKNIIFKPEFDKLKLKDLKDILTTGSSSAVGSASGMMRNMVLNRLMVATALSATALSALSIMNTVLGFASCVLIGVGLTSSMVSGMILGDQDRKAAEELIKITTKTCLVIGIPMSVLVFVFANPIAKVFIDSSSPSTTPELVELATRALRFYSLSITLYGINNAFVNYTQGMRRMALSNAICFIQNFLFIALAALALVKRFDADAIWGAYVIGETATLLTIIIISAIRYKTFPHRASDFLFLKEPFGAPEDEIFEVSLRSKEEVTAASQNVYEFCQRKSADSKSKVLLSLFVEELGNNVAQFGFANGEDRSLDIRVIHTENGWNLRLRDNCKAFDPTEWIKLHEDDDPTSNIGIRIVCGMAKDISYLSTLDLNILTIQITNS